jgi:N utilization substance protein B
LGQRRKARELAAQTLYALSFREVNPEYREYEMLNSYPEILNDLAQMENLSESPGVIDFANELVMNSIIHQEDITKQIEKHSENWSEKTMAKVDRSILQLAIYELMFTDTPAAVIINEALEIAKKFCGSGTIKFLNGVLDAVNKELRDREKIEGDKI